MMASIAIVYLVYVAIMLLMLASMWKINTTFGQPGWACIVPIYNIITMLRVVGWDTDKFWLFFIPIYNIYLSFMLMKDLAAKYGKDTGFAVGLLFLGFIFLPLLAFKSTPVKA